MGVALSAEVGSGDVVQPGSFVWVTLAERNVAGWWVVEDRPSVALADRQGAVVREADCSVVWSGPVSESMALNARAADGGPMPAWAPAVAGSFWAARRASAREEAAKAGLRACEARLERIVEAAHDYADDQRLCDAFDRFMIRNGLRPRSRDYLCSVDVTIRVQVPASSYSTDAVEVTNEMVAAAVRELSPASLVDAIHDYDVADVREA